MPSKTHPRNDGLSHSIFDEQEEGFAFVFGHIDTACLDEVDAARGCGFLDSILGWSSLDPRREDSQQKLYDFQLCDTHAWPEARETLCGVLHDEPRDDANQPLRAQSDSERARRGSGLRAATGTHVMLARVSVELDTSVTS